MLTVSLALVYSSGFSEEIHSLNGHGTDGCGNGWTFHSHVKQVRYQPVSTLPSFSPSATFRTTQVAARLSDPVPLSTGAPSISPRLTPDAVIRASRKHPSSAKYIEIIILNDFKNQPLSRGFHYLPLALSSDPPILELPEDISKKLLI